MSDSPYVEDGWKRPGLSFSWGVLNGQSIYRKMSLHEWPWCRDQQQVRPQCQLGSFGVTTGQSTRWVVWDHGLLAQLFSQDACQNSRLSQSQTYNDSSGTRAMCVLHSQRKVSVFLLSFNSVTVDPSGMLCLGLACMPVPLQLLARRLLEVKARLLPVCLDLEWQPSRVTSQGASDLVTKSLVTLPMSLTRRPPRYLELEPRLVAHWENTCFSYDLPETHGDVWLLQRHGLIGLFTVLTATFPPHADHLKENPEDFCFPEEFIFVAQADMKSWFPCFSLSTTGLQMSTDHWVESGSFPKRL